MPPSPSTGSPAPSRSLRTRSSSRWGSGLVGSMFVRSITIYLVQQDALDRYVYLEHGAHWAIGALAVIMLVSIEPRFEVPDAVTASVGVVFIGAALGWSVLRNRRHARAAAAAG